MLCFWYGQGFGNDLWNDLLKSASNPCFIVSKVKQVLANVLSAETEVASLPEVHREKLLRIVFLSLQRRSQDVQASAQQAFVEQEPRRHL